MKKKVVSNAAQKRIPLATSNIQNKPTLTNKDNGAKGRENKVGIKVILIYKVILTQKKFFFF